LRKSLEYSWKFSDGTNWDKFTCDDNIKSTSKMIADYHYNLGGYQPCHTFFFNNGI